MGRLAQVLSNFISNAIKFTSNGNIGITLEKSNAPENPTVFVDVLVLTDRLLVSLDMSAGSNTLTFFKISEIQQVLLTTYTDHVRLQLTLSGIGSVYVNTDIGEYVNVQQFALTLRDFMRSIF